MAETARGANGKFVTAVEREANLGGTAISAVEGDSAAAPANFIDPSAIGGETGGDDRPAEKRGRGRPRKEGSGKAKEKREDVAVKAPLDFSNFGAILFSIHEMLAAVTSLPEMRINEDESKRLGEAAANVAKLYDMRVNQKALAWTQLSVCAIMVYGPRIYMIADRKKAERKAEKAAAAQEEAAAQAAFVM